MSTTVPMNGGTSRAHAAFPDPSRLAYRYTLILLLLGLYYLSYRYPLQINSASTSETYRDTPFLLAVAKYLLLLGFVSVCTIRASATTRLMQMKPWEAAGLVMSLYLCGFASVSAIVSQHYHILESGIFFVALTPFFIFDLPRVPARQLSRHVMWFVYVAIVFELVQLGLFYYYGRLPALGWRDSLLVRFGSVWDDPNGWAIFLCFVIPFVAYRRMAMVKKALLILTLLLMLVLTQSFTGIVTMVLAFLIARVLLLFYEKRVNPLPHAAHTMLWCIGIGALAFRVMTTDFFAQLLYLKADSIRDHFGAVQAVTRADVTQLLGLAPSGMSGESGYVNMLTNFGLPYLVCYLALGVAAIVLLLYIINRHSGRSGEGVELFYGMLFYVIAFYIGMVNLPLDTVFPVNLLLVVFFGVTYVCSRREHGSPSARTEPNAHADD